MIETFGRCDCDRHECSVQRALRTAAADACSAAVQAEYGPRTPSDFHISAFRSHEWVCRSFPYRNDRPCPGCGYAPRSMPTWVDFGTVFALGGRSYRVVSIGSTNRFSQNGLHSEDMVVAELLTASHWSLPDLPATKADVGRALDTLFKEMPRFRPAQMDGAFHLEEGST